MNAVNPLSDSGIVWGWEGFIKWENLMSHSEFSNETVTEGRKGRMIEGCII